MVDLRVIGIDPGPVPGIVLTRYNDGPFGVARVVQCDHHSAPVVLAALLEVSPTARTIVQIERFVVGRRSSRSTSASAGEVTRELIGELSAEVIAYGRRHSDVAVQYAQRSAAQVKPWATDARLEVAGLLEATKGMRHARDAARHALFAAVHDGGIPDPLGSRGRAVFHSAGS